MERIEAIEISEAIRHAVVAGRCRAEVRDHPEQAAALLRAAEHRSRRASELLNAFAKRAVASRAA